MATAAMDEASKSAWYRERGLYPQDLEQWRVAATQVLAEPEEARGSPRESRVDRQRIKELERELRRKPADHPTSRSSCGDARRRTGRS